MRVAVLPGDGIGKEVTAEAVKVLQAAGRRFGFALDFRYAAIGGSAIEQSGEPFPAGTAAACRESSAVLLGAVGGPEWDSLPPGKRPESGLLALRKTFNLFANLRPAVIFPGLASFSRLRPDLLAPGVDLLVVRELVGDVYFGQPAGEEVRGGLRHAFNNMIYNEEEIRRIAHVAFGMARQRRKKVCSVDKANVLAVSRLWRAVVHEVHREYQDIVLEDMYVDNAAMQLISAPSRFDVILTGNIFGDILSDESAAVVGSLGLLPSASLGEGPAGKSFGVYEPVHGSAPDIAGQNKANPLATILSAAMLLRLSLDQEGAASAIEQAVRNVLAAGHRTADLQSAVTAAPAVSCTAMGDFVVAELLRD